MIYSYACIFSHQSLFVNFVQQDAKICFSRIYKNCINIILHYIAQMYMQQQEQKCLQVPQYVLSISQMNQKVMTTEARTHKLFQFARSLKVSDEPSTQHLLSQLKICHIFISDNEELMGSIQGRIMKQLVESPTMNQKIFVDCQQAEEAYAGKKVIVITDIRNAQFIISKLQKYSHVIRPTWFILGIYVLIQNEDLNLYGKQIKNQHTDVSNLIKQESKQNIKNQSQGYDVKSGTNSSISCESKQQQQEKSDLKQYQIADKIEFMSLENILEKIDSVPFNEQNEINIENLLKCELKRLSLPHLIQNLKQFRQNVNLFIVTTGPRADKTQANRYHDFITYILNTRQQILLPKNNSNNMKQQKQQKQERTHQALRNCEKLFAKNDDQVDNQEQFKWKNNPEVMGIKQCKIQTIIIEQQKQIKSQKFNNQANTVKEDNHDQNIQNNKSPKKQSEYLTSFLSNYDDADINRAWNMLKQYTNENNFHKKISHYSKLLYQFPFGTKPLEFPILAMTQSINFIFVRQLQNIVKWMKKQRMTELKAYRGCYLNQSDRRNLENCVGHILQFKGFMSTSYVFEEALAFAHKKQYLIELIVSLADLQAWLAQIIDGKAEIPYGQGFAFVQKISSKPQQKQIVFNILNYWQFLKCRQDILKQESYFDIDDPLSPLQNKNKKITIYSLRLINPKLNNGQKQNLNLIALKNYPYVPSQFYRFYQYQQFKQNCLHTRSDHLLFGQHHKEAEERLIYELEALMKEICPDFKLRQYIREVIKGLKIQLENHSIKIRKGITQPHIFQSTKLSAKYISQFKMQISHENACELLFICYKLVLLYRLKLQIQNMYAFSHLYIIFVQFYGLKPNSTCSNNVQTVYAYKTLIMSISGIIYLADCYFVIGMYEARLQILEKLLRGLFQCRMISKLNMHPNRPVLRILNRIMRTQKLLSVPQNKHYMNAYIDACMSALPAGIDRSNISGLYNFINHELYTDTMIDNITETVGKQGSSAVMFGKFKKLLNEKIKQNSIIRPITYNTPKGKVSHKNKVQIEAHNNITEVQYLQSIMAERNIRSTMLTELFGTHDEKLIEATVFKIINNEKIINYKCKKVKQSNQIKLLVNIQQEDLIYRLLLETFITKPLKQLRKDADQECKSQWYDMFVASIAFKVKFSIQKYLQSQQNNKQQTVISLIKQQDNLNKKSKQNQKQDIQSVQFSILKQQHKNGNNINSPMPLLSKLSIPESLLIMQCKQLTKFQRNFRSIYINYYSEQFQKYCKYQDKYEQAVLFYQEWQRLMRSFIQDNQPTEITIGGPLYFQWMIICQSLSRVTQAFYEVKNQLINKPAELQISQDILYKLTLTPQIQKQLLYIFDVTLSHISRVRFASQQHIILLFEFFVLKSNIYDIQFYGLDNLAVGTKKYYQKQKTKANTDYGILLSDYDQKYNINTDIYSQTYIQDDPFLGPLKLLLDAYQVIANKIYGSYKLTEYEQNVLKKCIKENKKYKNIKTKHPELKDSPEFYTNFLNISIKNSIIIMDSAQKRSIHSKHNQNQIVLVLDIHNKATNLIQKGNFDELFLLLSDRIKCAKYNIQFYNQQVILVQILKQQLSFKSCENILLSGRKQLIQQHFPFDQLNSSFLSSLRTTTKNTKYSQYSLNNNFSIMNQTFNNSVLLLHQRLTGQLNWKTKITLFLTYYVGLSARPRRLFQMIHIQKLWTQGSKIKNFMKQCKIYYESQSANIRQMMMNKLQYILGKQNKEQINNQLLAVFDHLPAFNFQEQQTSEMALQSYIQAQLERNNKIFSSLYSLHLSQSQSLKNNKINKNKVQYQFLADQFEWLITITPTDCQIQMLHNICKLLCKITSPLEVKVYIEYILTVIQRLYRINELNVLQNRNNDMNQSQMLTNQSVSDINDFQLVNSYHNIKNFKIGNDQAYILENKLQRFKVIYQQIQDRIKNKITQINYLEVPILLFHLANIVSFYKLKMLTPTGSLSKFIRKMLEQNKLSKRPHTKQSRFIQLTIQLKKQSSELLQEKMVAQVASSLYKLLLKNCKAKAITKLTTAQYNAIMFLTSNSKKSYMKKYKNFIKIKHDPLLQKLNYSRILKSSQIQMQDLLSKIQYCDRHVYVKLNRIKKNCKIDYHIV